MLTRKLVEIDGRPSYHYECSGHALLTGPVQGQVVTADGTTYDVSPDVIEIQPGHAGELAHLIGLKHEADGHPAHRDGVPFVHQCDDHCGEFSRG